MSFALDSDQGPRADVPKKILVTDPNVQRSRAMAFYRQRLDGLTDREIGKYWGRSRQYVNSWINSLTPEQKRSIRRDRLRSIRADHLLREEEFSNAG